MSSVVRSMRRAASQCVIAMVHLHLERCQRLCSRADLHAAVRGLRLRGFRVDPARITLRMRPFISGTVNITTNSTFFLPGPWDRFTEPYPLHPFVLQRLQALGYLNGEGSAADDWNAHLDRIRMPRYEGDDQPATRATELDEAIRNIAANGFRSQVELGRPNHANDIGVYITSRGELVWARQGDHRLTIAKTLGIDTVPVVIRGIHWTWARAVVRQHPQLTLLQALERGLASMGFAGLAPPDDAPAAQAPVSTAR